MQLDFIQRTNAFTVKLPRSDGVDIQKLMREHGLDFSSTASTADTALLFTKEPYAAVAFSDYATERARAELLPLITQIEASWKATSDAHIKCPADKELWDFQKADIEYAMPRHNTLVGDQPGLGKTQVGICMANEMAAKRVLVMCPASIRVQWIKRIREWTTMRWPFVIHPVYHSRNGVHPTANWTVCSYDLAHREAIGKALAKGEYDLLILDEAHYLKTPDSRRTRAIFGGGQAPLFQALVSRSERVLALTGTPLPNRPREAYTLARGLCWDAIDWASEDGFRSRFNPSLTRETAEGRIYIDERTGRHAELQARLRANFMVRHEKHGPRGVMSQLQMPVYDIIQLEETGPVKQALAAENLLDIDPEDFSGADAEILGHVATVRRMMGVALAPQVADYCEMLINGGEEKLVLFAWHKEVLDILCGKLQRYGVVRIDGNTTPKGKEHKLQSFINDPTIRFAIGNILSMGIGTDGLQEVCNHGLIAEPDWVPGNNIQCFDRLDRGGQKRQVQGDIFVAPNSFAERVLVSALRKGHVIHQSLDRRV